ncbi:hypothetical protein [Saccharopolyspora oryzae]|uniref:hypothetical protein n=1 Tax=Saccharopolyspora oryzae TaxID=2997343 RepID=UPI0022EB93CB|nr:hypothetical protein [Saccharopolyspora oryzae]
MTGTSLSGALHDPETLRGWRRARRRVLWALILLTVVAFALPFSALEASDASVVVCAALAAPPLLLMVPCTRRQGVLKDMKPILETYPWHDVPASVRGEVLKVPNPDEPGKSVEVIARRSSLGMKRRRAVVQASVQGFRFAGDPRFGGVIALRARPGQLITVVPRHRFQDVRKRPRGVSEAAWQRAREAGISGESRIPGEMLREQRRSGR